MNEFSETVLVEWQLMVEKKTANVKATSLYKFGYFQFISDDRAKKKKMEGCQLGWPRL